MAKPVIQIRSIPSVEYGLRKALKASLIGHAVFLILLALGPYLGFGGRLPERSQVTWVVLPRGTEGEIGAGFKKAEDLPKATIEESKLPPPPEPPKKEEKVITAPPAKPEPPKAAMPTPASKKDKKTPPPTDISRALERIRKQVSARNPEAAQIKDAPGGVPYGAAGASRVSPNDPEYIRYQAKIRSHIIEQWIPPIGAADASPPLTCRIQVMIDATGRVITMEWDRKSGDELFDLSAVRAIRSASPLEVPPEKLLWEAMNEGFLVEFVPTQKP